MTSIEKAIAKLGGQAAAARALELSGYQVVQQWVAQGRVPAEHCPRIERLTGVRCEELNDRVDWSLIRGTTCTVGADEPLRTRMLQLAGEVAAAKARAASDAAERKANLDRDAELRRELSKARARNYELEQQVLTLFGATASAAAHVQGAAAPTGLICTLAAQAPVFARKLADLQQRGYHVLGHILHKDGEYALMDGSCRWLTQPQYQRLMHEQDGSLFGPAGEQVDHAAELRRAISETRIVFESEPVAGDALNYLESVLDTNAFFAAAPVPAQTGIPGGGTASITEASLDAAGAVPMAGLSQQAASSTADQAADAMAAESAQLVAQAERSIAARAPLTPQQVDKIEDRMLALLAEPLTDTQREAVRITMVAEFRALNAMGVQQPMVQP